MIKNVLIFTLLQMYARGKKYDLRKGEGGKEYHFQCKYRPKIKKNKRKNCQDPESQKC